MSQEWITLKHANHNYLPQPVNIVRMRNWCTKGIKGCTLQHRRIGAKGTIYTTPGAIHDFLVGTCHKTGIYPIEGLEYWGLELDDRDTARPGG